MDDTIRKMRNTHKIVVGKNERRDHLVVLVIDGRTTLKFI
jgi:hypothetical protein